ncbi:hypothetical protein JW935_12480 [candidate division KSB1 bacterium]|nr:hypothetical protein [candidate division KSB1 bacterium]
MNDKGARLGWLLGGTGSLLWIIILAGVQAYRGQVLSAVIAAGFFVIGLLYLFIFAPWKHVQTQVRFLYLGFIFIVIGAAAYLFCIWYPGAIGESFNIYQLFILLPLFTPVFVFGKKKWSDLHNPGVNKAHE